MPTYYHYTSRLAARLIIDSGQITPGRGGTVYLTDDDYVGGAEAASRLAIPPIGPMLPWTGGRVWLSKPVEVRCVVPDTVLTSALGQAEPVLELRNPVSKAVLYSGGGRQLQYRGSIAVSQLVWQTLQSP